MRKLAFYRDFQGFSGGHLKVWDYYCHTKQSAHFRPTIYFTPNSLLDSSNPWVTAGEPCESLWNPDYADALFLGGMDWLAVPEDCGTPVINLVQGVRHAAPEDPRHRFLERRALRICVSQPVADAIAATGIVNGPIFTIPAGLDLSVFPEAAAERDIRLLIAGMKQPELAKELSERLAARGFLASCLTHALPRTQFLDMLGRADITVFLPLPREGFYMAALEGMAMGTLVICPDCAGNRQFCLDRVNCRVPHYDSRSLLAACLDAFNLGSAEKNKMLQAAKSQTAAHSLVTERAAFLNILLELTGA